MNQSILRNLFHQLIVWAFFKSVERSIMSCEIWDPLGFSNNFECSDITENIIALKILNVVCILILLFTILGALVRLIKYVIPRFCNLGLVHEPGIIYCVGYIENGTRNRPQESQQTNGQNSNLGPPPCISPTLPPSYDEAVEPTV